MSAFEELGVSPELIRAVEELGWLLPTPVQAEAVPLILGGGDVMAAAETGSGKTGAFSLPVLQIVHEALRMQQRGASTSGRPMSTTVGGAGGKGGAGELPACVMSTTDRDAVLAVSPGGLAAQSRSEKAWGGGRATMGAYAGKVYYEVRVTDEGLARVGWSTSAASHDLGTDRHGWGYGGTGKKSHNRQFDTYGTAYGLHDVIGCCLDADTGAVSYTLNGKELGEAARLPDALRGQLVYPAICVKNAEVGLNFGAAPWACPPPPGYQGIGVAGPGCTAAAAAADGSTGSSGRGEVKGSGRRTGPLCVVLEPSRDLAEQTATAMASFARHLTAPRVGVALLVGGVDAGPQLKALREGVEVVVGTPGRIIDFVEGGKLALDAVRFLVLDEADRLVADAPEVIAGLYKRLPKGGTGLNRLQVLLFSATLHSPEVRALAGQICQDPLLVDLKGREHVPEAVDHAVVVVDPREDRSWLQGQPQVWTDGAHALDKTGPAVSTPECWSEAVKRLKPRLLQRLIDRYKMEQALIFVRTNHDADNLERFLAALGGNAGAKFRGKAESGKEGAYSCVVLGGARSMEERRAALAAFKEGDVRFLIATDVAARGLDIKELPYVINMTLPDKSEDYIHRVGRVGRADTMGLAISLVAALPEKVWYCTVKGYKPWLEPDAKNTRTQEQGGHTIWYDEPALLQAVEKRLGRDVARLGADLSLPPGMAAKLEGGGEKYGQARGGGTSKEVAEHLAAIHQNVQQLGSLEVAAQGSFLALKTRWVGAAGAARGTSVGGPPAKPVKA